MAEDLKQGLIASLDQQSGLISIPLVLNRINKKIMDGDVLMRSPIHLQNFSMHYVIFQCRS